MRFHQINQLDFLGDFEKKGYLLKQLGLQDKQTLDKFQKDGLRYFNSLTPPHMRRSFKKCWRNLTATGIHSVLVLSKTSLIFNDSNLVFNPDILFQGSAVYFKNTVYFRFTEIKNLTTWPKFFF